MSQTSLNIFVRPVFAVALHRSEVLKVHAAFLEPVMWKHDNDFQKNLEFGEW